MTDKPEIYCCIWRWPRYRDKSYVGIALSEDGVLLAERSGTSIDDVKESLGIGSLGSHGIYKEHYDDYYLVWLDEPMKSNKFARALSLNHVIIKNKFYDKWTTYRPPLNYNDKKPTIKTLKKEG